MPWHLLFLVHRAATANSEQVQGQTWASIMIIALIIEQVHILTYLILKTTLGDSCYYYPHCTDKEVEAENTKIKGWSWDKK